ncbi:MAG: glycine oxidase ThiO [Corynebacterium casei]|uniref:glycine oxidase ThiO n=1 Tax=Corynebacterium casei TaxID=160386 RepID=UPI000ED4A322|nr:glycine oxidase ThiO [Corynebacterium casei]MDN5729558.1 glycine oxidase ThiO [Corynebacterium casei]MDN6155408.1 glycine oxidase ThiO [Corynebacterium casei]MDN6285449.1 glycine oxidase ThiO [Corynebacterium casei]MDN6709252.1 glycine oxidase ThiO [Corynebacterium casei]HCJ69271.1 glycine oxidase ThiO [Corynebacterium casei]
MTAHALVIGGGIIGLSTCFEFQDAGFEVTLIDPDPISGATHHAGGMLAPTAEVQYQQQALVPLMKESAQLYPDLIRRVTQYTDLPTGYRTEGTLLIGADRADAQHLTELIDYIKAEELDIEALTTRQARQLEPALSPRITKAAAIDGDHQLDPRLFARALFDAVLARGAQHVCDTVTTVTTIAESATHQAVTLNSGAQFEVDSSDVIILAAGLGAAKITGWFEGEHPLQLRPVYGDVLRVRVPESLQPLTTRVIRGFVEDRPIYVIPRADGTVTIGATSREDQPHPRTSAIHDLLRDAIRVVPGLEETEFLEATCGARPGTPDDLPYLGQVRRNLIVSTGYFRHGILLAALGARTAVQLATGQQTSSAIAACDPFRHATSNLKV